MRSRSRDADRFLTGRAARRAALDVQWCCARAEDAGARPGSRTSRRPKALDSMRQDALSDGAAAERFDRMVAALGGPRGFLDDFSEHLPGARRWSAEVTAGRDGLRRRDRHARARPGGGRARRRPAAGRATRSTTRSASTDLLGLGAAVEAGTPLARHPRRRRGDALWRPRRRRGHRDGRHGAPAAARAALHPRPDRLRCSRALPSACSTGRHRRRAGRRRFGDEGANTLGHIARPAPRAAPRRGLRAGRCAAEPRALGLGRGRGLGRRLARLRGATQAASGLRRRGLARQGHAVAATGRSPGVPVPFDWGLFPAHRPVRSRRSSPTR